jgi:hypothetical protein
MPESGACFARTYHLLIKLVAAPRARRLPTMIGDAAWGFAARWTETGTRRLTAAPEAGGPGRAIVFIRGESLASAIPTS